MTIALTIVGNEIIYIKPLTRDQLVQLILLNKTGKHEELKLLYGMYPKAIKLIGESSRMDKDVRVSAKIAPYIGKFTIKRAGEVEVHYRDYTKTIKEQKDKSWLINMCSDVNASWRTLMRKLNNPVCCVIWGEK